MSEAVQSGPLEPLFEAYLNKHDDKAWRDVIHTLSPEIHEVDRIATEIWFYFFPLLLCRALKNADDEDAIARKLLLDGTYRLRDQIDSSHSFFYGHRYWPEVKEAVISLASSRTAPTSIDLASLIRDAASSVAKKTRCDRSLAIGITAVGFMTLQQVGTNEFRNSSATITQPPGRSPEEIVRRRKLDDRQGVFSFMRPDKLFTITFNEQDPQSTFQLINTQHLTTAAANDKREHHLREPRCIRGEGPIPVQCRSASCGTCWIGVLAGAEKLSEVRSLEWKRIKEFGYIDTDEPRPMIRLACQAQAFGNISIIIPPWNGVFGSLIRGDNKDDNKVEQ